ncbi:unnamed protein product [Paramecium sonneborni]|uniref:Uncharacterized protein n=1 Tax=Paramecium sonneborni TaxID=65129 RepID=A0A8S1LXB4_9CILI|nr:unnamed protein product [Paramecium sonneborni]
MKGKQISFNTTIDLNVKLIINIRDILIWIYKRITKKKQNFEPDIKSGSLGRQAHNYILERLQPNFWFIVHMHVKFEGFVKYKSRKQTKHQNHKIHEVLVSLDK